MNGSLRSYLRRKTIASFDYQWRELPEGDALLSDERFRSQVTRILCEEELCVDPAWFPGKTVLDVGCGNGRWCYGFLGLGASVVAMDAAPGALEAVRRAFTAEPRLEVVRGDILEPPPPVAARRFDLVFAWGVLHHTGDVERALANACSLAREDGFVYVYLYGKGSWGKRMRARTAAARLALLPFSPAAKRRILSIRYRGSRLHGAFDMMSPPLNARLTEAEVRRWFADSGLTRVERTVRHSELFLKAWRPGSAAESSFTPPRPPPYWFREIGER